MDMRPIRKGGRLRNRGLNIRSEYRVTNHGAYKSSDPPPADFTLSRPREILGSKGTNNTLAGGAQQGYRPDRGPPWMIVEGSSLTLSDHVTNPKAVCKSGPT